MNLQDNELNFQHIWKLFAETDRRFKETDEKFKETDEKFKETDEKFKETDEKLAKLFAETDRQFKETAMQFKETDRRFKETDKRLDRMFKQTDEKIGKLTGKWGLFIEGLIIPAAERLFNERGIKINSIYQRVKKHKNNEQTEIDILAIDDEYAVLVEAKSTLGVDDVKEHIDRISKFKYFFPEYSDKKVLGAAAGIVIEKGADRYAYKNGLFVIAQSGEGATILNDEKFKPKIW